MQGQMRGMSSERTSDKKATKTLEERFAAMEQRETEATSRANAAELKERRRTALDAIADTVPEARRKSARAIARGLSFDHDIGAADNAAAIVDLTESMKKEHPELFEAPKAQERQTVPYVAGPSGDKNVEVIQLGVVNEKGRRVI